jgi:glutamate-5-semialdehyde dehydrogenase
MKESNWTEKAQTFTRSARRGARQAARADTATKNAFLENLIRRLGARETRAAIAEANQRDLENARTANKPAAFIDRLELSEKRLDGLVQAVRDIHGLEDPVGRVESLTPRPSGIQVGRMRIPLGVVLMVYESRPNVTVDTAALCIKAGNAVILRGGKEAFHSNQALVQVVHEALADAGLDPACAVFVDDTDRELLYTLLKSTGEIDLAIPRGGRSLIEAVTDVARVPVVQHFEGICHVYVHADADLDMAQRIALNAKVNRPGVCNAMECLLVDQNIAEDFLPAFVATMGAHGVEVRGCEKTLAALGAEKPDHLRLAVPEDFDTEFLSLTCATKVVSGLDEALDFLGQHGSNHTESIVTENHSVAMRFLREVDASCVMINASTRFNDGGQLGLGAELGISTTKLHAYGPMGLEELCAKKFVVLGKGEILGTPPS